MEPNRFHGLAVTDYCLGGGAQLCAGFANMDGTLIGLAMRVAVAVVVTRWSKYWCEY